MPRKYLNSASNKLVLALSFCFLSQFAIGNPAYAELSSQHTPRWANQCRYLQLKRGVGLPDDLKGEVQKANLKQRLQELSVLSQHGEPSVALLNEMLLLLKNSDFKAEVNQAVEAQLKEQQRASKIIYFNNMTRFIENAKRALAKFDLSYPFSLIDAKFIENYKKLSQELSQSDFSLDAKLIATLPQIRILQIKAQKHRCEERDLSSQFGPVHNQKPLQWCAIYSAADVLSAKFQQSISPFSIGFDVIGQKASREEEQIFKNDLMSRVSSREGLNIGVTLMNMPTPLEIKLQPWQVELLQLAQFFRRKPIDFELAASGSSYWVSSSIFLNSALKNGYCTEKDFDSELRFEEEYVCAFEVINNLINKYKMLSRLSEKDFADLQGALQSFFPSLHLTEEFLKQMAQAQEEEGSLESLFNKMNRACKTNFPKTLANNLAVQQIVRSFSPSTAAAFASYQALRQELHHQLDQYNPLIAAYDASVLYVSDFVPTAEWVQDAVIGHASVVAGRHWDEKTQTCQILVRNSWGSDWKPSVPQGQQVWSDEKHSGYFWISEDKFLSTLKEWTYLKSK